MREKYLCSCHRIPLSFYPETRHGRHLDLGGSSFLGRAVGWELGHGSFSFCVFDYFHMSYLKMTEAIREEHTG